MFRLSSVVRGPFRFVFAGLAVLGLGGAAVLGGHLLRSRAIEGLQRQLSLAQADQNAASVRELARRLARLDETPEGRLRVAEVFLSLNLPDDFWSILQRVEKDAPELIARTGALRARGYLATGQRTACVASLQRYLRLRGLSLQEKLAAWDELAEVQGELEQWSEARAALEQRLALGDSPGTRLKRASVLVRMRFWADAQEAFGRLARTAASDPGVKEMLPRWERVERGLAELRTCDDAVKAAPGALKPWLERAQVEARLGLWQNAADVLRQAVSRTPLARARLLRLPLLLGTQLGMKTTAHGTELDEASGVGLTVVPWLAPGSSLRRFNERWSADAWGRLEAVDVEIAGDSAGWVNPSRFADVLAKQAEIECQLGWHQRALADALALLQRIPGFLPAQQVKIAALLAADDVVAAGSEVEESVREHTDEEGHVPVALVELSGYVRQRQGRHHDAVEAFSTCLSVAHSADLLRARASSLRFLQRFAEADQDAAEADALAVQAARGGQP